MNTSSTLEWNHRAEQLTELAARLQDSGYGESFRGQVVRDCVLGWERKVEAAETGGRPLYRPREWQKEDREKKKLLKKTAWYRPHSDFVTYVPATPQGKLMEGIKRVVEEESSRIGVKVKVVERGGVPLGVQLFRPEERSAQCGAPDCFLDMGQGESGGGGHHHRAGCLYRGTCNLCKELGVRAEYTGESGFSGYTRTKSHLVALRKDRPASSAMADHIHQHHPEAVGREGNCSIKVLRTFNKPLDRQLAESVLIHRSDADILLNRKEEWLPPVTYRLQTTQEPSQGQEGHSQGPAGQSQGVARYGNRGRISRGRRGS